MSRLLRANFSRLWKSTIFWIGMVFTFCLGLIATSARYREMMAEPGYHPHMDNVLFSNAMFMPIISAVFVGLFIGTEYSDGTIRNKLIVGHTRASIYFSNLVVCTIALFLMHLAYIAVIVGIGFPLIGNLEATVYALVKLGLISLVTVTALSAFFLMMGMLIHSKANGAVAAIIVSIVMLMSAMIIQSRLTEPEYWEEYDVTYKDDSGKVQQEHVDREKNPNYLTGTKRKVYEFLYDFLPGGQMVQITTQNPQHPERLVPYSLSIIVATTACGVFFFDRKNIK